MLNLINKSLEKDIKNNNFDFINYKPGSVGGFSIEYFGENDFSITSYIYKNQEDLEHDINILTMNNNN